jgi:phenylacetic acid degradation operon negative regulatory protein
MSSVAPADPSDKLLDQIAFRAPSLLVTIWGDMIAPTGQAVWLGSLIRLAAEFGLNERVVRTAVFRLQKDGWLQSRQEGRRSFYDLAPAGRHLTTSADVRIYRAAAPEWDGRWLTLIANGPGAGPKDRLTRELLLQGFGQAAPGVFVRPGGDVDDARSLIADLGDEETVAVLASEADADTGLAAMRALVARAWDHAAIDRGYAGFIDTFDTLARQAPGLPERDAFVVQTLLVHEFRRITLRDPMLPSTLLPPGQSGAAARALAGRIYGATREASAAYATNILEGHGGRVVSPGPAYYHRFTTRNQPDAGEGGG